MHMFRSLLIKLALGLALLVVAAALIYQLPPVQSRLGWRIDFAMAYVRGVIYPVKDMPTPDTAVSQSFQASLPPPAVTTRHLATLDPTAGATQEPTAAASPTPTRPPLPASASLTPPAYEKQDLNNCGPTTLSLYLRYYGWQGTQYTITDVIKPVLADRNVNVDELIYFASTRVGWLKSMYRVGGNLELLKSFLAYGLPIAIEEGFRDDASYWPNDDLWAGHYLLLTGYNDKTGTFITQDTFYGANREVPYAELDHNWEAFNRVYLLIYPPDQEDTVKYLLGENWDEAKNRQNALAEAQAEASANPKDAFAWFNVGTNQIYFQDYTDAAQAYDTAREIGLPQRMLRYQFGPFVAYFNTGRTADLLALTEYALKITPNSEEDHLWHGWALVRKGDNTGAAADFRSALEVHPNYQEAIYALNYIGAPQ